MTPLPASLLKPFVSPTLVLRNRIAMAPMTRGKSPRAVPGADVAAYYRRRAEGGVGLLITEGTPVHPLGSPGASVPNMFGEECLAAWKRIVDEVHCVGGKIIPQLWHVGPLRNPKDFPGSRLPVSPSGIGKPGDPVGEVLTESDIAEILRAFADATRHAKEAGFDGVEIHGAHGYLIDLFFWQATNLRRDAWGGDLVGRTRFAAEIVRACRREVGPGFHIQFRYSQWKQQDYTAKLARDPGELARFLEPLTDAGVDLFHCSSRRFWEAEFEGSPLNLAGWTKKLTGRPVLTVGGVDAERFVEPAQPCLPDSVAAADLMVARGEVDGVAVGRALIGDPRWVEKWAAGAGDEIRRFAKADLAALA